jgi:methionyl-tRNA formyltransferase
MGTTAFAVTVLSKLAASATHRPALVVTPPDRPRGRGRRLAKPPVAEVATELGIALHQTESVNLEGSRAAIADSGADIGVVCAFGQLIREPLLSELEMLNVHPSLLPRWRGAAPIERAIMAGDSRTGVSIAIVDAGLDSGPVALREPAAIEPGDDHFSLAARLAELAGPLAMRALDLFERGGLELTDQDDAAATYAAKIDPAERRLDPARPAVDLERAVRALRPHIGAYLELDGGERLGVLAARAGEGELRAAEAAVIDGALIVGCGEGVLELLDLKPAGGRAMAAEDYLRGHPLPRPAPAPAV